ncbi:acyl-CoA thioester hydrolase [Malonomonas rubra DSM 5091]|uniref:Acyl-CoA thioester hydrolase n=1 Tax=Malonomonas rubra DSM 5091 TaxID=1122189 RepID=A0A1M6GQA9_MALRU|nr:thioesterase family protein [Malonomonas rubra]SHJ12151.1 acyl-CoA thioester hydrolase [Malonomonas rubra DSM 5091]
MKKYQYRLEFQVRDYECDLQGVVNNAVYQQYLEHARHEFIKTLGLDFAELAEQGLNLVVIKAELEYKRSLRSGDRFWAGLIMEKISPLRYRFRQDIFLQPDNQLVLKGWITGTGVNAKGRPQLPKEISRALNEFG